MAANGQLIIGSTGADPVIASLTGSEGITVTEGAGTLALKVTDDGITLAKQASGASRGIMVYQDAGFDPTLLAAPATGLVLKGKGTTANLVFEKVAASEVTAGTFPAGNYIFTDPIRSYGGGAVALNLALGAGTLAANTTGSDNVACGASSLFSNSIGYNNTGCGAGSLQLNTTGYQNTACGNNSLSANLVGIQNTACGTNALFNNVASGNTATGYQALYTNSTGIENTACGLNSLVFNTIGTGNSGFGFNSLYANTTGISNTACGALALNSVTTGSNLTAIGYDADASSATATNEVTLGNASVATLRCQVTTITAISDERDKTNIGNIPVGLEFINRLKPREFTWNMRDGSKVGIQEMGFIAQELDQAQKEEGITIPGLVFKANPDRLEAAPGYLLPILVKAIQELSARVKELEAR